MLILYSEVIQKFLVIILCREAGIGKKTIDSSPFPESAVIVEFQIICNDERNYSASQTLFEHNKPPHTPIPVLKRMDGFKLLVEINNILKVLLLF